MKITRTTRINDRVRELPERIRTRSGNVLLRLPDILRVGNRLYISKWYMDKTRNHISWVMEQKILEMTRNLWGVAEQQQPAPLTYEKFQQDMGQLGIVIKIGA